MSIKVKKPLNSFFLYRKQKKNEIVRKFKISKSHEISRKAAELWKSEPADVKEYYNKLSFKQHEQFKLEHPDFDWQPWVQKKNKLPPSPENTFCNISSPATIIPLSPESIVSDVIKLEHSSTEQLQHFCNNIQPPFRIVTPKLKRQIVAEAAQVSPDVLEATLLENYFKFDEYLCA
ncbi:hypothetical protein HDV04_002358 [Boothiomyces sp. JEL0838]|nr:hypothetical protein HDV04_002343 [Boothiomyces sp. JEL0838]KAJ3313197.1 hypothetical protein HDV04_002358 [Boothiomyces sp. JEL0838]